MRFCFLASRDWVHPEAAGGDLYLGNLARGLASRGHKVIFLAASPNGNPRLLNLEGVEIRRLRPGLLYPIRLFRQFVRIRDSVDVTVEEIFGGKKIPSLAFLYSRRGLVGMWYQCHERIFREQYPRILAIPLTQLERFVARLYSNVPVATLSTKSAEDLVRIGLRPSQIGLVPSAALMTPLPRKDLPDFKNRRNSIVFVGKLRRYKRVDHAILAMKEIANSCPDAKLIIAGNVGRNDMAYVKALRELADEPEVKERVQFEIYPGLIPPQRKTDLLKESKVLVQTSPVEGFSMTSVEAGFCGTPAVVSDGVPRDTVMHGENGFVYPFGDARALAGYCTILLTDSQTWSKMSDKAHMYARRFSWESTIEAFEAFLDNSLGS